ncbi:putative cupredoxin-like copper-binding protein [Halomonas ventosae]|uniref:Putative cupredoxin-like copper-binding protein n=1 Tax=Halomonas ventosae TaxID=229007 RepID=A0A4R6ZIL1_9GAMM|nr:plastocyanin/azurin family copper-binding protein [Halomonas ventosae]TDR52078.1 putative cupredoxin-like copper-binding protein [Halomonas ventosae]
MRKTLLIITLGLIATPTFAAGKHGGSHGSESEADIDRTIRFEAGDMWFDPEGLDIVSGETIRFEIANTGNLEHEFVIGDTSAQEEHRKMMLEMAGSHGESGVHGGHGGHDGHDMAEGGLGSSMPAVTIAPGETAELVWTAPENAGDLEYACNIPGHYEAGMYGDIDFQG